MCGINGLINFSEAKNLVKEMNDTLKHRGPDAEGIWHKENVCLGHRRLSIIDLSPQANQPFVKNGLVITYNGEVYNFREIKEELFKKGVKFKTNSDTEVVLEVFRLYREESFSKLRGMFAFAIYDSLRDELFLVRDYFGIKPLYYAFLKDKLAFSSELKTLLKLKEVKKELNYQSFISSLNFLWIYGENSIIKGIKRLSPAHYLHYRIKENSFNVKRYWYPDNQEIVYPEDEKKLTEKLDFIFKESISKHLIADVEVSAFLSGGLDSSLVSVLAKRAKGSLYTYTINFSSEDKRREGAFDDRFFADYLAKKEGFLHSNIEVKPDIIGLLKKIVYHLDEPIGDPAAINTYLICEKARERGCKVLLSGMGADELFGGYRRHLALFLAIKYKKFPLPVRKIITDTISKLPVRLKTRGLKEVRWLKRFLSFAELGLEEAYLRSYSYYSKDELKKILKYNFNKEVDALYNYHKELFYEKFPDDIINKMCWTDINMFLPGLNLAYTDKASMANSVEVRVPFVDKEVVGLALSLSGSLKIKRGKQKYLLKKMADKYLPDKIVNRPKASFGVPLRSWISKNFTSLIEEILNENSYLRELLDINLIREMVDKDKKGFYDYSYQIYQLLTLNEWFKIFFN